MAIEIKILILLENNNCRKKVCVLNNLIKKKILRMLKK